MLKLTQMTTKFDAMPNLTQTMFICLCDTKSDAIPFYTNLLETHVMFILDDGV